MSESAGALHVIVGAGPVGTALAERLVTEGNRVRLLSRSGRARAGGGVESVAVDATDPAALASQAEGAAVLYNCANPRNYTRWEREWPPLADAILHAAERTGAVLVTASNLYGYGPVDGPITASTPSRATDHKGLLRERLWHDALSAHEAGRVRVAEARSSDYLGPTVTPAGSIVARYAASTLRGRAATVFADPDQPHTWTAIDDVAATLAVIGKDERAWGSVWIVPSNPATTVRELLRALGDRVGQGDPRLRVAPRWALTAAGAAVPLLRELTGVLYQFDRPFVADGADTTAVLGLPATPWEPLLDATAHAWREGAVAG